MVDKRRKSRYDIYLSDEGKGDYKIVIKGNNLDCRLIGSSILVWSEKNTFDILNEILIEIDKKLKLRKEGII